MVRLIGFFLAAFVLTGLLAQLPVVGALFRIPILGFWFAAILLSLGLARLAAGLDDRRRAARLRRSFGTVDTPANRGKLGVLLLQQGRPRRALTLLERAHEEEPAWGEWAYRLGEARLLAGDARGALAALDGLLERDEEHAYGRALLLSARAAAAAGDAEDALARLERHDRNHGPTPESVFERGGALRALGRREEARRAFGDVGRVAVEAGRFRRERFLGLRLRAALARLG